MKNRVATAVINQNRTNHFEDILRVAGTSGTIESVAVTLVWGKVSSVEILVDGDTVCSGPLAKHSSDYGSSSISLGIPFKNDLVVRGRNWAPKPDPNTHYWVIYSINQGNLKRRELVKEDGVWFDQATYRAQGNEFTIETNMGLTNLSEITLDQEAVFDDEDISGTIDFYIGDGIYEREGQILDLPIARFMDDLKRRLVWNRVSPEDISQDILIDAFVSGTNRSILYEPVTPDYNEEENRWKFIIPRDAFRQLPFQGELEIRAEVRNFENYPEPVKVIYT